MAAQVDIFAEAYTRSTHGPKTNGIVCTGVICKDDGTTRANTRWAYAEINRQVRVWKC